MCGCNSSVENGHGALSLSQTPFSLWSSVRGYDQLVGQPQTERVRRTSFLPVKPKPEPSRPGGFLTCDAKRSSVIVLLPGPHADRFLLGRSQNQRVAPKQEKDRPPRPRPPKPQARVKPRPSGHRAKSSKAWSAWRKLPERQQRSASPVGRARESLCSFLSSVVLLRPPSPPSLQPPRPPQPPNPCGRGCMRKQSRGEATHLSEANALLPRCPHCRSRRRECKRPLRARHR